MKRIYERLEFDGVLAILFVIIAAVAFAQTYSFPAAAAVWPRWVIGCFGILSALVPLSKLTGRDRP